LNYLGIINTQTGNLDKAIEYLTLLLRISPNDVVALTGLGSIQIDTNQIEIGLSNLRKAIEIDNLYYPAH
jgi:tetratricopeptide (TPR) repeat protein